ncbi:hypothetical protein TrCOL_g942 [Triparma columacea]|uniref:Uncharacterized protein n=1 Tax=Triparma columacea TaxID=722753 RepID=A0A9W7G933_9STRA|nr:hypothetical protein TrCOL_g942 [Triparma columacea]
MVSTRHPTHASLPMGLVTHPLPYSVSGIVLYIASPFFATVPKLVANFFCGAPYSVAYKHFRRDHMDPYNLFFHVLIMILQLTTNFAFLHQLDEDYLRADVSVWGFTHKDLSALGWVLVLLFTPSPFLAKLLSAACIYLAHYVSSSVASMDATTIWFQPFLDSLVIIYFLKKPITPPTYLITLTLRFTLHHLAFLHLSNSLPFPPYAMYIFLIFIASLSHKPFSRPASGVFGFAILGGWLITVVTGNKIFYLWACGFVATALQGVSHRETKEPPTMPQLNNISFELSHVVFFPCLLMQAIGEHLQESSNNGKRRS